MKVLIVSPCVNLPVPAVQGGAVSTLIEYLIKENESKQEMQLTVLSVYDAEAAKKAKVYSKTNIEFISIPKIVDTMDYVIDTMLAKRNKIKHTYQYIRKLYSLRYISRYMIDHDFDKVVFQNSGYLLNILNSKNIANKYKGKLYYHLHNDIPNNVPVEAVKQCKLLLISEYLKRHIVEVCGQDVSEQCIIVRNGIDCSRFSQNLSYIEKQELKKKIQIEPDKKIIMFAGRIDPAKGIFELTEAFSRLNRNDIVLMVVGAHNFGTGQTSKFQEKMEKRFFEMGNNVCFTGYVPYEEMWKYYNLADVAVLPSIWEEPAGLTILEACAAGIPLITTNSGGIPEYILAESASIIERDYLIDNLISAINNVLDHENIWKKKSLQQKEHVFRNYNVNKYYEQFVKALLIEKR